MSIKKIASIFICFILIFGSGMAQDTVSKSKWQAEVYGGAWSNNKSFSQPPPEELFNKYAGSLDLSISSSDGLGFDEKNMQFYSVSACRKFSLFRLRRIKFALGAGIDSWILNFYTLPGYRQRLEELREQYYNYNQGQVATLYAEPWDTIGRWMRYSNLSLVWRIKVIIRLIGSVKFNVALSGAIFAFRKRAHFANYVKIRPKQEYKTDASFRLFSPLLNSLPLYFSGDLLRLEKSNFEWELGLVHPSIKRPMMLVGTNYNF